MNLAEMSVEELQALKQQAVDSQTPAPDKATTIPQSFADLALGGAESLANSITLGFGDELSSGLNAAGKFIGSGGGVSFTDAFNKNQAVTNARMNNFADQNPVTDFALRAAGTIPATVLSGGTVNPIAKQAGLAAIEGFGRGDTLENRFTNAGVSGVTGAAGAGGGKLVGDIFRPGTTSAVGRVTNILGDMFENLNKKSLTGINEKVLSQSAAQAKKVVSDNLGKITTGSLLLSGAGVPVAPLIATLGTAGLTGRGINKLGGAITSALPDVAPTLIGGASARASIDNNQ